MSYLDELYGIIPHKVRRVGRGLFGAGLIALAGSMCHYSNTNQQTEEREQYSIDQLTKDVGHLLGEKVMVVGDNLYFPTGQTRIIAEQIGGQSIRVDSLGIYIERKDAEKFRDMFPTRLKELKQRRDSLNGLGLE